MKTAPLTLLNADMLIHADEIESAVLVIHGEKAHSRYFGEAIAAKLKGDNKELMIIPGASHCDLYDQLDIIPFDKMVDFYKTNLK